jgi:acyl-coenzyme A thioesterase PaaI-like protein
MSSTCPEPEPTFSTGTPVLVPVDDTESISFVGALGIQLWTDSGVTHGRSNLVPAMWRPGTQRPRLGVLATLADIVAGMPPTGALTPTVDLNIQLMAPPPSAGTLHAVCLPTKAGRRLFVGEILIDSGGEPFARGSVTFLNQLMPGVHLPGGFNDRDGTAAPLPPSLDDLLEATFPDERTVVVECKPALNNGPGGTVQGGVQATIAEVASEWALSSVGTFAVTDLDIRYLNRVNVGPVSAVAEVMTRDKNLAFVRVALKDAGDGGRLVSAVTTVCHRVTAGDTPDA